MLLTLIFAVAIVVVSIAGYKLSKNEQTWAEMHALDSVDHATEQELISLMTSRNYTEAQMTKVVGHHN
ncbi:hypothetical protein LJC27_06110 [Christensenellaceae bacterium OttesenSCG-928-M15]|nr:hypothetical protein [Christensenellaceae bacterium OttesenSCG-928-M15]